MACHFIVTNKQYFVLISCQFFKHKKKPTRNVSFLQNNPLAVTYFPTPLQMQYRQRYEVSLPCSGWERVGPSRSYHQEKNILYGHMDSLVAGVGFEPTTFGL